MRPIVRNIVMLVTAMTLFLIALSILLWGFHLTANRHAAHSDGFLAPSKFRIAQAQRSLERLQIHLYVDSTSRSPSPAVPYRFSIIGELDALERHLVQVVRLAHTSGYVDAFALPTRAHRQFEDAREVLQDLEQLSPGDAARALAKLEPLAHTLEQLERIYELDEQTRGNEQSQLTDRSVRLIVAAIVLLLLVAVPSIVRLSLGLRTSMRRELRSRRDLEEAKENLELLAMYDSLTELGNRNLFKARLEQVVESANRSQRLSTLLYIDLDNFKRINDSLGHDAGDDVLKIVAARLGECVRSTDTVARLGGDEFTVILTDVANSSTAGAIARKILRKVEQPMRVASTELVVSASIGITLMPLDGDDATALMKNADMALYKAKEHGRNNFQFFVEEMNRTMVGQMAMENDLRTAIRNQGFALHHQPQLDLATGKVICMEALLRWPQPDGKMISPADFIPIADATGLLNEIGGWVLDQACRDLARLRQAGAADLRVSVDLSAGQFRDPQLLQRIESALHACALEPSALEIEITETTLIENIDAAVTILDALRKLGTSIAIDDFGVGYSSLSYLKHLPIDALKIDKSFVRDIETDEADRSIVHAVLAMAHSLSLRVVAEGIESEGQLQFLTANRCNVGQGFLFSKPVPAAEISVGSLNDGWSTELAPDARRNLHLV